MSLDTLGELHQQEIRRLRKQMVANGILAALAGSVCVGAQLTAGTAALGFLFGYLAIVLLFRAVRAGRAWSIIRQRDPVTNVMAEAAAAAQARAAAMAQAERFAARPAYATWTIAGVLIAIGVLQFLVSGSAQQTIAVAGLDKAKVAAGESWRILTATFLHGAVWHLYGNLVALLAIGRLIEAYSTRSRLLLAYLVAAIAGNFASCVFLPHGTSIGASGGILGLAGFLYALSRRRPTEVPAGYGPAARTTMVLTGVIGVIGYRFIDNAAHAGGALAGFLVGWLTVPRELPPLERSSEHHDDRVVAILGVAASVVLAATAVFTAVQVIGVRAKPVTSVRVELLPRSGGGFSLRIENFRDVPLEAYSIDVQSSRLPAFQQWRDERGFDDGQPGSGPIAPHERRLVPLGDTSHQLRDPSVKIVSALFADGTFEGSWREYDTIILRRNAEADDADYWIGVIDEAKTKPPDQIAAFINTKISEHQPASRPVQDPGLGAIGFALHLAVDAPDRFATGIEPERERLVKIRDALRSGAR